MDTLFIDGIVQLEKATSQMQFDRYIPVVWPSHLTDDGHEQLGT